MATETLYPDAILSNAGDVAISLSAFNSAPDGTWSSNNRTQDFQTRVSFPTPSGDLNTGAGLQTIRGYVRRVDGNGNGTPSFVAELWENGSLVASLGSTAVSSTTGVWVSYTFDASVLGNINGSQVEVYIEASKNGGGPNEQSVQIDSLEWIADYSAPAPTVDSGTVSGSGAGTGSASGDAIAPPTTFTRDFANEATGVGVSVPSDFTFFANGATNDFDVVDDPAAVGGKFFRFDTITDTPVHYITWDTPGSHADIEYVMQVRTGSLASAPVMGAHTFLRASRTTTEYVANRFNGDPTAGVSAFYGVVGDEYTGLPSGTPKTTDTGVWWVRAQVIGDAYKAKYWKPSDPRNPSADEPVAWDIETSLAGRTPTPPTAGYVAFGARESSSQPYLDLGYIGVSTDPGTESAPLPPEPQYHAHADFSSDTVGQSPSGWTKRWQTGTDDIEIISNSGPGGDQNAVVRNQSWASDYHHFSFDEANNLSARADFELLILWNPGNSDTQITNHFQGRAAGDTADDTNDALFADWNGTPNSRIVSQVDNGFSNDGTVSLPYTANTWYWIRFRCIGSQQWLRYWEHGTSEPGTWDRTATRSVPTAPGWIGFGGWSGSEGIVAEFNVATGGETAFSLTSGSIDSGSVSGAGFGAGSSTSLLLVLATASATGTGVGSASPLLIISGAATGVGTGSATAAGASVVSESASGVGAGQGSVDAINVALGDGTGNGAGTGASTGLLTTFGVGSSPGVGFGSSSAILIVLASAAGAGAGTGVSSVAAIVTGTATGAGSGLGTSDALSQALGSASGSGEGLGTSQALLEVLGASTGSGEGLGSADSLALALGSADGTGVGSGTSSGFVTAFGSASGSGVGSATASSEGSVSAQGSGSGTGLGSASGSVLYIFTATGGGSGSGQSTALVTVPSSATGAGTGTGVADSLTTTFATATGSGTGSGLASTEGLVTASATGSGQGSGTAVALSQALGAATGLGEGSGTGQALLEVLGAFSGTGEGTGSASGYALAVATASGSGVGAGAADSTVETYATATGTGVGSGAATGASSGINSATGVGTGSGTASATLVQLASATATGVGSGSASALVTVFASATGAGTGAGTATSGSFSTVSSGAVSGTGIGSGTGDALSLVHASASGAGVGSGQSTGVAVRVATATGTGSGLGGSSASVTVLASVTGSGTGAGSATPAASTITGAATGVGTGSGTAVGSVRPLIDPETPTVVMQARERGEGMKAESRPSDRSARVRSGDMKVR